jgi:hypothetical protein
MKLTSVFLPLSAQQAPTLMELIKSANDVWLWAHSCGSQLRKLRAERASLYSFHIQTLPLRRSLILSQKN